MFTWSPFLSRLHSQLLLCFRDLCPWLALLCQLTDNIPNMENICNIQGILNDVIHVAMVSLDCSISPAPYPILDSAIQMLLFLSKAIRHRILVQTDAMQRMFSESSSIFQLAPTPIGSKVDTKTIPLLILFFAFAFFFFFLQLYI